MSTKTIADLTSWLATVIAFVFACVGIFSQPPVFESSRPKLPTQENTPKTSGQQPPSRRLAQSWDDPYVVFKPTEDLPQNSENQNHKSPALLLIVLTGMSDYQIDSETRLRNRYAIQSALRDSDYIPEASGELNAASVQLKSGNETLTFQVPTESFRRRVVEQTKGEEKPFCFVRVAWFPERLLTNASLQAIRATLEPLESELAKPYGSISLCVIGPTNSDTLARICIGEAKPLHATPYVDQAVYPRFLNFQATAAAAMVRIFALQESKPDEYYGPARQTIVSTINEATQGRGPNAYLVTTDGTPIERVGADDFELCQLLIDEIDRRTRTTGIGKRRILLIAEWDTFYGRAAALALRLAAARVKSSDLLEASINGRAPKEFDIDSFYYMRGLDGTATLYSKKYPSESATTDPRGSAVQPAEGVSQFDYIRRLSDFVGEPINIFSPTFKEPDAIVVLGTDIYDKLTLLKSLRQRFTQPLYLTTDLDALYWHPNYVRFTRNLIVATSFPLEIVDASQRGGVTNIEDLRKQVISGVGLDKLINVKNFRKVVFRDSYQSALYYATQSAIDKTPIPDWATTPKLFEIGNTKAVRLDNPAWAKLTVPNFWEGYLQGVNPWPSLILQTVLPVVALSFLARLRSVKYEQRCFPREFFDNLKLGLPATFHQSIDDFAKLTAEILMWSSAVFPSQLKLNIITQRVAALNSSIMAIHTQSDSLESLLKERLLASLETVTLHFKSNVEEQANWLKGTSAGQHNVYMRATSLRKLRVRPWWIARIVIPVLRAVEPKNETNAEIHAFARYSNPKGFCKNPVYIGIIIVGLVTLGIYFNYNHNFEGIVGTELRDFVLRWYRVLISFFGICLVLAAVVWTCSEQWQFRQLVEDLLKSIGERSALQDRQIVTVVAARSNDLSHLSWKPCILIFILYVAHLRVFVGPPFDLFQWFVFVGLLVPVCVVFFLLSATTIAARQKVVSQYQKEIYTAKRLNARLASIVKNGMPIQDDLDSTALLIAKFAAGSSYSFQSSARAEITPTDLRDPVIRQPLRDYLTSVIARDEAILSDVAELRSDALSPFAISSILGALLVPIGGAGGLTLLQYIVTQVK